MEFYTVPEFSRGTLILSSYKKDNSGNAVLLDKLDTANDGTDHKIRLYPKKLRIRLSCDTIIFKNIKVPLIDKAMIKTAIRYEYEKNFKLEKERFVFDHSIWKREPDGIRITLLGIKKEDIDKYIPLLKYGFMPEIEIACFYIDKKGLQIIRDRDGHTRIYYDSVLIAWRSTGEIKEPFQMEKIYGYLENTGFNRKDIKIAKEDVRYRVKTVHVKSSGLPSEINKILKTRVRYLTAVFGCAFLLLFIISGITGINSKKAHLAEVKKIINDAEKEFGINPPAHFRNRIETDPPALKINQVIEVLNRHLPGSVKVYRLLYGNDEIILFLKTTDIVETVRAREALEKINAFRDLKIEEGADKYDQRIIFKIKKLSE